MGDSVVWPENQIELAVWQSNWLVLDTTHHLIFGFSMKPFPLEDAKHPVTSTVQCKNMVDKCTALLLRTCLVLS
jgi:hypothetical protein